MLFRSLVGNKLTSLPREIADLTKLDELTLYDNPLTDPPAKIVEQGITGIMAYFRGESVGESVEEDVEEDVEENVEESEV